LDWLKKNDKVEYEKTMKIINEDKISYQMKNEMIKRNKDLEI
jgi:hypothetical protein